MICCGNFYLCQAKNHCEDCEECHAIWRAQLLTEADVFKPCRVVWDGNVAHYEFVMPIADFGANSRQIQKRLRAWRRSVRRR